MAREDVSRLALQIARCPEVERARHAPSHPCRSIVRLQSDDADAFQVPEAWAGNLEDARVVFLSSNPSISEDGADHGGQTPEQYPRGAWSDDAIVDFMTRRFEPGAGYAIDDRFLCQDGSLSPKAVVFWSRIRRRATELLGYSADPASDYVMTEIVHCKSKNEIGVGRATAQCAALYLGKVLALCNANVVVVVGAKARDRVRDLFALPPGFGMPSTIGDEAANTAVRAIGDRDRVVCYLPHPTSMVKGPRYFASCYPDGLERLRAVAKGEISAQSFR